MQGLLFQTQQAPWVFQSFRKRNIASIVSELCDSWNFRSTFLEISGAAWQKPGFRRIWCMCSARAPYWAFQSLSSPNCGLSFRPQVSSRTLLPSPWQSVHCSHIYHTRTSLTDDVLRWFIKNAMTLAAGTCTLLNCVLCLSWIVQFLQFEPVLFYAAPVSRTVVKG